MLYRKSKISKKQLNKLIEFFIDEMTASFTEEKFREKNSLKMNRKTVNLYFNHFRERLAEYNRKAPRFSGEVEMDQTFFGKGVKRQKFDDRVIANPRGYGDWKPTGKKKISKKIDNKIMVFGILRRGGNVYTHIIKRADRDTLFPIIHLVVEPKTVIYTDSWAGFNDLKIDGYEHRPVNHSLGRVGIDGAHTGGIDSFWSYSKRLLGRFRGISRRTFPLHLKECEFRWNCRDKQEMKKILKSII